MRTRAERGVMWHKAFDYLEPMAQSVGSRKSFVINVRWENWERFVGPRETTRSALVRALDELESLYGVTRIGSSAEGFRLGPIA